MRKYNRPCFTFDRIHWGISTVLPRGMYPNNTCSHGTPAGRALHWHGLHRPRAAPRRACSGRARGRRRARMRRCRGGHCTGPRCAKCASTAGPLCTHYELLPLRCCSPRRAALGCIRGRLGVSPPRRLRLHVCMCCMHSATPRTTIVVVRCAGDHAAVLAAMRMVVGGHKSRLGVQERAGRSR